MLNEEKQGERRSLSELMGKSAALDEQLSPQLKELLKLRAEEAERAAETAQKETARRVAEAEKAAQESARRAEQAERQLAAADPEVATFKAWFRAVQDDFARMQETHAQVTDQAKADKLRAAVRALLERERTVWG